MQPAISQQSHIDEPIDGNKIKLLYKTLGLSQPITLGGIESPLLINSPMQKRSLLVLPIMPSIDKHFQLTFDGAASECKYEWGGDDFMAQQKGSKQGKVSKPARQPGYHFYSTEHKTLPNQNVLWLLSKVVVDSNTHTIRNLKGFYFKTHSYSKKLFKASIRRAKTLP